MENKKDLHEDALDEFVGKLLGELSEVMDSEGTKEDAAIEYATDLGVDIHDIDQLDLLAKQVNAKMDFIHAQMQIAKDNNNETELDSLRHIYNDLSHISLGILGLMLDAGQEDQ